MHELSIVMGIVDIASKEALKANASSIEEIELDIGKLSTIEMDSFDFAWKQGVKNTILENATKTVNRIEGRAKCHDCEIEFPLEALYDPCPQCGFHLVDIISGKEVKVKSLMISN